VLRNLLIILLLFIGVNSFGQQQNVEFHLTNQLLTGIKILKVKRDYKDPYLWVLAQNNQVYRINSQTFAVNDYTAQFAAYSNLHFTDIAGLNKDTVCVSANSPNIVVYEKGVLKQINQANGLTDAVTSIGIGAGYIYTNALGYGLMIGTTKNFNYYDLSSGLLKANIYQNYGSNVFWPVNIFTLTYRTNMITWPNPYFTGTNDCQVLIPTPSTYYATYIYNTPTRPVNTAYYYLAQFGSLYGGSSFWGNSNGLYQQSLHWNQSFQQDTNYYHCLNGIKVNKIADILGLTSIPGLPKDDLLVGTDNGLYFTSSLNDNDPDVIPLGNGYGDYIGPGFSTFYCNEVGNVAINDICTNATTPYSVTTGYYCENGVWLGTNNGVYFITPDYGKFLNPNNRLSNIISFSRPSTADSSIQICMGDSARMNVNLADTAANLIQWQKNGQDIIGATKATLTVADGGDYNVILYDPCENIHFQTNHLYVTTLSAPVFTFNYPDTLQYCDSASATLNVTKSSAYHYRWYHNGVLNGDTTATLTATQSGKYYVEVSACSGTWFPTKPVVVNLVNLPQPNITSNKGVYCQSDIALLSANSITDTSYTINWYRDDILLPGAKNQSILKTDTAGNYTVTLTSNTSSCSKTSAAFSLAFVSGPSFTFNYPDVMNYCAGENPEISVQGNSAYQYRWFKNDTLVMYYGAVDGNNFLDVTQSGKYRVEVSACQNSWVPSKEVQINIIQLPTPVISTDKPGYCIGDNATLTVSTPPQSNYNIYWSLNGARQFAYNNQQSIVTNVPGNYSVAIFSNVINTDNTTCMQFSTIQNIAFTAKPTLNIQQLNSNNLCQGQTANLMAVYTGDGSVKWSNGESGDQIAVNTAGTYTATLITPSGCTVDTSISVTFLPDPVLSVNDTTICTYKNQTITLNAPAGYVQYSWNGQPGNSFYSVTQPQTVNLMVTDANGCQASAQIHVTEQCPDVEIPNAFTPNGDGINDYWQVEGLDNTATINIFNRYGTLVYQSKGNTTPWDGTYHGSKLSAGVYYYIIKVKNGKQTYSGSVTILY
jgi:gliding motility-associated-like protein